MEYDYQNPLIYSLYFVRMLPQPVHAKASNWWLVRDWKACRMEQLESCLCTKGTGCAGANLLNRISDSLMANNFLAESKFQWSWYWWMSCWNLGYPATAKLVLEGKETIKPASCSIAKMSKSITNRINSSQVLPQMFTSCRFVNLWTPPKNILWFMFVNGDQF